MLIINPEFDRYRYYNFISNSINKIVEKRPEICSDKAYRLYYYISGDFFMNVCNITNEEVSTDVSGFPYIQRHTRHMIEAVIDLYNLCCDERYSEVLEKNNTRKETSETSIYGGFLYKGKYTWKSKMNIAYKMYGNNFLCWESYIKRFNSSVHPDVNTPTICMNDMVTKQKNLAELFKLNFDILNYAYELMKYKYNGGVQPQLCCNENCIVNECETCRSSLYNAFIKQLYNLVLESQPQILI